MNELARRAGLRVHAEIYGTFPQMEQALLNGDIDVIPNYGVVEGRLPQAAFTPPVETFSIGLFVRSQSRTLNSLDDLAGRKVAAVSSNAGAQLLEARGIHPVVYPSISEAMFALLAGEVDALAFPSPVLWARAREVGVADRLRALQPPLAEINRAMAVRAGDRALLERLTTAVNAFVGTPEYQRIYVRWYGEPPPYWTVRKVLVASGLAIAALLLAAIAWRNRVLSRHNRELREHIAERDQAQAALLASESKYRQIVETSTEGVWVLDATGITTFANLRMAELLGLRPHELVGRPASDFFAPELAREAEQHLKRGREGRAELYDFRLRTVAGKELAVLMAASPIMVAGEFRGALVMVTDVTDRRLLEAELRQSQRLEALGRLTGGIAHDFNNLLFIISTALTLAKKHLAAGGAPQGELDDIEAATERATALTSQLLAFARRRLLSPQVLRPADNLRSAAPLLRHLLGKDIELSLDLPEASGAVTIDPAQLEQLVFNLASNARDAMPAGGHLTIAVADQTREERDGLPAGDYVTITVADDGSGIPPDVLLHVFDPFFTTKAEGRGTGLGLATCHGIAAQAGGRITVTSRPGEGSRFTVILPRSREEVRPAVPPRATPAAPATGLSVLLVEDEPTVRRMVLRILHDAGFVVHPASAPGEALRLCREHAAGLDVLLTDFRMPGMNGQELAQACRELIPELPVVYMSGDIGQLAQSVTLRTGDCFLAKPFSSDELLRTLPDVGRDGRRRRSAVPPEKPLAPDAAAVK